MTAVLSAVCYALSYILLRKVQVETTTDPVDNGLFNILLVGVVSLFIALGTQVCLQRTPVVQAHDWLVAVGFCVLSGLTGTLFGRLTLFAAIAKIGATRGVIINAMAPIVTLTIAVLFLGEVFNKLAIIGMGVLALGILLMTLERMLFPTRFFGKWFRQGVTIAIMATLFQGLGYTFRKIGINTSMTPLFAASLDMGSALFVYFAVLAVLGRTRRVIRVSLRNMNLWVATAGLLSAAAIVLFYAATDLIPVSQVSIITATQPVIVALLSGLFMNKLEHLTWLTATCSILVTLGVILIGR
jgi:drug/metabolite transporter (DMT)-like permease